MADSSDEDKDSRTALVGASSRTKANPRSTRSASHDSTSRPAKRQRKNKTRKDSGLGDIVPRGGSFSENTLAVDPDSTSSSGSSDSSDADSTSDSDSESERDTDARNPSANPHEGNTTPAISWNQGQKAAVRTSLGKRSAPNEKSIQFTAVNDKYWRSRSDSVSSASDGAEGPETKKARGSTESAEEDGLEEGEVDSKSESDDTSLDSEADDSILLNIGEKANGVGGPHDYDPATLAHQHGSNTTTTMSGGSSHGKEEAFRQFARKYPTAPTSLIDLSQQDLEIQAKIIHFSTDIHDLDLRLPVSCIECQREGHLADVCPSKEVWSLTSHQSVSIILTLIRSAYIAAHGTNTKVAPVPAGGDAKDVASEAMMSPNASQNYAAPHLKPLVIIVARITWSPSVITYGNSHPEKPIPNKPLCPSVVPIVAA